MNGYARVVVYTWDTSSLRMRRVIQVYEGGLNKGLNNHHGFGRIIDGLQDYLAVGYFNGPRILQGQYLLFEDEKLAS